MARAWLVMVAMGLWAMGTGALASGPAITRPVSGGGKTVQQAGFERLEQLLATSGLELASVEETAPASSMRAPPPGAQRRRYEVRQDSHLKIWAYAFPDPAAAAAAEPTLQALRLEGERSALLRVDAVFVLITSPIRFQAGDGAKTIEVFDALTRALSAAGG